MCGGGYRELLIGPLGHQGCIYIYMRPWRCGVIMKHVKVRKRGKAGGRRSKEEVVMEEFINNLLGDPRIQDFLQEALADYLLCGTYPDMLELRRLYEEVGR